MSRQKKTYVGKIGYCPDSVLFGKNNKKGHYVYIRSVNGSKCDVNVFTSLEDKQGKYTHKKLFRVRNGDTYSISKKDTNFTRWTGIKKDSLKDIKLSDIQDIGKKTIKQRHKFFIGKYMK